MGSCKRWVRSYWGKEMPSYPPQLSTGIVVWILLFQSILDGHFEWNTQKHRVETLSMLSPNERTYAKAVNRLLAGIL